MKSPIYSTEEFISSANLNAAVGTVSGDFQTTFGTILPYGGLCFPEIATNTVSGLVVNSTLSAPFGVLFATGIFAQAHGINTNQDTQSYSTNFASLVPASGTVTVYLLASYQSINQNPYQVIGPQPGHPDFDPTFLPYIAYRNQVDSLNLTASTIAPDNATTFELGRGTLSAAATGIAGFTSVNQIRAASQHVMQPMNVSGVVNLGATHLGKFLTCSGTTTLGLPDLSLYNGCIYTAFNPVSGISIQTSVSGQSIYGYGSTPAIPVTGFTLPAGVVGQLVSMGGNWIILGGNGTDIAGVNISNSFGPQQNFGIINAGSINASIVDTVLLSVTEQANFSSSISVTGNVNAEDGIFTGTFTQNPANSGTWYTAIPNSVLSDPSGKGVGIWFIIVISENVTPAVYMVTSVTSILSTISILQLQAGVFASGRIDGSGNFQISQSGSSIFGVQAIWLKIGNI